MSDSMSHAEPTIYALNVFTLKDPDNVDSVVELVKKGILTTSSKNPGYLSDKVFKSADGKAIVNMSEWGGGLPHIASNHQRNEINPDYQSQMEEIGKYADFAAMAYTLVFEHTVDHSRIVDEQSVVALMRDLGQAVIQRNRATVERVLADDFKATGWNARTIDRAGYIHVHFAPEHHFTQFEPQNIEVRLYGDMALVFGVNMVNDANLGHGVDHQQFTAVALRRGGIWSLVAYQETLVPQTKPAS